MNREPGNPVHSRYVAARLRLAGAFVAASQVLGSETLLRTAAKLAKGGPLVADDIDLVRACQDDVPELLGASLSEALSAAVVEYQAAIKTLEGDFIGRN